MAGPIRQPESAFPAVLKVTSAIPHTSKAAGIVRQTVCAYRRTDPKLADRSMDALEGAAGNLQVKGVVYQFEMKAVLAAFECS